MVLVQNEVKMGWSGYRRKCLCDGVGTEESGYEIELVQDELSMGWCCYRMK